MSRIPKHLQPFLEIAHYDLPEQHIDTAKALIEAIEIIDGKIRINKKYQIIIGKSPFKVPVHSIGKRSAKPQSSLLTFKMAQKDICVVMDDYIFIDYLRLSKYIYPMKVVCILEELVHALMNVVEHPLTNEIVCLLYPDFFVTTEGKYRMHEAPYNKFRSEDCSTGKKRTATISKCCCP